MSDSVTRPASRAAVNRSIVGAALVSLSVKDLGAQLANLRPIVGTGVEAPVALVFDWASWWALGQSGLPTNRLDAVAALKDYYRPLWEAVIAVDVVEPTADLSGYGVVIAPSLYVLTAAGAANLTTYRQAGGHLVLGAFSGVADANAHVRQGRFPVLLRDLLGVSGEEWLPLPDGGTLVTWVGTGDVTAGSGASFAVETFAERFRCDGAEVLASFVGGELDGLPAITKHAGAEGGAGWYVGTILPAAELARFLKQVLAAAGVRGIVPELPVGVEVTRRGPALFVLNHTRSTVDLDLEALLNAVSPTAAAATDLLSGTTYQLTSEATRLQLLPDDVVVLTERS